MKRISGVWFLCLGGFGAFFPFFSLYLHENLGLAGSEIGRVLAILPLVGIVAQPLWGQIADRSGARDRVVAALAFGAALGYLGLLWPRSFVGVALATGALALFHSSLLPNCVAVTLALSGDAGRNAFGRARMWGTLGFACAVVAFPRVLDAWQRWRGLETAEPGPEPGMSLMFPLTAGMVGLGGVLALTLPRRGAVSLRAPRGDWQRLLRHRPYLRALAFVMAAYTCVQGPMFFFPVFVRSHGGSPEVVSEMWVLMLLLEVPLLAWLGTGVKRLGARGVLATGVLAAGVRWTVCGFAPGLAWVYPVQILHGVVVAGLVIGGPLYVDAVVPERLRSTGQGLLAVAGMSVGGIASNLASGWLLERVGAWAPYAAGGVGALLLAALLPAILPAPQRPPPEPDEAAQESITLS